jgi:RecB family exonuclease
MTAATTADGDHLQGRLFVPDPGAEEPAVAGPERSPASVSGTVYSGRFPELEPALCARVVELKETDALAPLTIVVGSAAVRRHLGDRLVRRLGGLAGVSLETLGRFAERCAAASVTSPPAPLTELGRERLLRRLLGRGDLGYFGPVAGRPHFARALAGTFADLREALIDPDAEWARHVDRSSADTSPAAVATALGAARGADLERLYGACCRELRERGLADGAAEYAAATASAPHAVASTGQVLVYGLNDLNRAQEQLIAALVAAGSDLFVPRPRGIEDLPAFAAAAVSGGCPEQRLTAPHPEADRERLDGIWRAGGPASADASRAPLHLAGDGSLEVVSVPDERSEAREAARCVLAAASAGVDPWDCAVIVPHGEQVERIAVDLQAAGLPVACRLPDRSPGSRVLLRLLECLAPAIGEPFGRRAVVDALSAAPLRGGDGALRQAALWLDEARRAGVLGGLETWTERVARRRRGHELRLADLQGDGDPQHTAESQGDDERIESRKLRLAAARSLEAAVARLARAVDSLPQRAAWGEWATALEGVVNELYEPAPAAAAHDTVQCLRALDVLDEHVDVGEMATVLREQLGAARVPVGSTRRDGVAVLTPLEARGLDFHTVVFTGLVEGGFPARGRPDPILGDAERRRIAAATGTRLPLSEARADESTVLFAFACEAAREHLVLIAPRTDAASGRPRLPSRLLLRLASLARGAPVGLDDFLSGAPVRPVWRHVGGAPSFDRPGTVWLDVRERDTAALLYIGGSGGRSAAATYLGAVLDGDTEAERRIGVWQAARSPLPGAWDGLLGASARAALAARHPFQAELHPTRLERYVACPFVYYLQDVLGLDVPEEPDEGLEMEAREFGTLAHDILQRAFASIAGEWGEHGERPDLETACAALTSAWEAGCAEAERRGVTGAPLAWEVRRAMLLEDLLESLRRDPVFRDGGGRPLAFEWSFGASAGRPVELVLEDGRRIRFAGRLDRLDVTAGGARVIDYKTGSGVTEQERLRKGLAVQLPVYGLAVRQVAGDEYEQIACLYRLVTRRGGFEDVVLRDDETTATERLRRLVTEAAGLVDRGLFPRCARTRCDFCDVGYACGVSAWTRDRKREHESLADLARLQHDGPRAGEGDADA